MKTTTKTYLLFITIVLTCFELLPEAQAVVPPPDGAYPGGNTAEGQNALLSRTTGGFNAAIGWLSLRGLTTGSFNTAVGAGTLALNNADQNTATGAAALLFNSTGIGNTADGAFALFANTIGNSNTANGLSALQSNITGGFNAATGSFALGSNTAGSDNTADGAGALEANTTGDDNTATGFQALSANVGGSNSSAYGWHALLSNTSGFVNTGIGSEALLSNTTGNSNVAVGAGALENNTMGSGNTALGLIALQNNITGMSNTALGDGAGLGIHTAFNVIAIGANGADVDNSCYIANIWNQSSPNGIAVFVNADGKLGTTVSSRRFKDDIRPMDKASEAILALQPVTFRYKKEFDPTKTAQFGLVAEEVEKVNPDMVVRDKDGKPYSVRYDQVNAMLLNEFLKEHRKVQEQDCKIRQQETTIAALKTEMAMVVAHLKEQDSKIQKVSDQLKMDNPAPQVAAIE
jgi:trimeric autotransporter adhesin